MRQDKALKILAENLDRIKSEFGVTSIGVFPHREEPACKCNCGCDCCGPRAKEIGVTVKYAPGANPGLSFFGLMIHIEELFGCGILLTVDKPKIDNPRWQADLEALIKNTVYVEE